MKISNRLIGDISEYSCWSWRGMLVFVLQRNVSLFLPNPFAKQEQKLLTLCVYRDLEIYIERRQKKNI